MDYIRPLATPALVLALVLAFALHTLIHRQSPRPRPLNSSPFTQLPPEIIQLIASFLPPSAAASFASTCCCIRFAAGTQYLSVLRASPTEKLALLELHLADAPNDPIANLPSRFLCVHCERLVPIYIGCGVSATPACRKTWGLSRRYIVSSFLPPLFYTIMAMHLHGHQCDELLSRTTPPTATTYFSNTGVTLQHSVCYHIATAGSLLIRTQVTYIFPYPRVDGRTYSLGSFCRHIEGRSENFSTAMKLVQTEALSGIGRSQPNFIDCKYCQTTVLVGARKLRGRGIGLFITWWKDLGDGRAGDETWANQVRPAEPNQPEKRKQGGHFDMPVVDEFEGHNARYLDFDGLSSRADRTELLRLCPYTARAGK
ncbi:hypothetical protein V502_00472 [Pseudogymnoascus sp. VKM F-4520 (FW-2644)]|nr:hypothetical protein V502_00472 [Pseudogymnoascus sp. VKM F-4520 (FW-2644)]